MEKEFWSVEHKDNGYADDMFNGTFQECVAFAKENNFSPEDFQLCKRTEDDDFCIGLVKGTEID